MRNFFINILLFFFLFRCISLNAQDWWCITPCNGTNYCDIGAITPTSVKQTVPSGSFCSVMGGGGHTNNFDAGSSLFVKSQFAATAGTKYCFALNIQGSGYYPSNEIDILATACGGAGTMIATTWPAAGTEGPGNQQSNCLTWTAPSTTTYYIQLSDNTSCQYIGANGFETVYFSYRNGSCGCSSGAIIALPVDLISFSGETCENMPCVTLNWKTGSELNNDYFSTERSTDAENWETIGTVKGAGNSSTTKSYEFVDESITQVQNLGLQIYYRLKQVDYDGKFEYYGPIAVSPEKPDEWNLIMKNIASDELQGTLLMDENTNYVIDIIDAQGSTVSHEVIAGTKGSNLLHTNLSGFSNGAYFIKVYNEKKFISGKFIKMQ